MLVRALLLAILVCAAGNKAVASQAWTKPARSEELGLLAIQCNDVEFCFAIACPNRKLQLVNIAPGGGPFGNPDFAETGRIATLTVGPESYTLSFTWDDRILEVARSAGSRSDLPLAALLALAGRNAEIRGTNTGPIKATIFSRGLKQRWPVIAAACGLPDLPR